MKYPWRLPDHEEPPADNLRKMEELAYVGEDEMKKSEVEEKLCEVSTLDEIFALEMIDTVDRGSARGSATKCPLGATNTRATLGL